MKRVTTVIVAGTALLLLALLALTWRAAAHTNQVALASAPKPVSVEPVQKGTFRPQRLEAADARPPPRQQQRHLQRRLQRRWHCRPGGRNTRRRYWHAR